MEPFSLPNIKLIAATSSAAFAAVALCIAAICIFSPRPNPVSVKLLGSIMALAMAFAANESAVYALSIFIIATLVTELDFLEKLAALFWNRDKYWEYRRGTSSASQVVAKVANDAEEETAAELNDIMAEAQKDSARLPEKDVTDSATTEMLKDVTSENSEHASTPQAGTAEKQIARTLVPSEYKAKLNANIAKALAFEDKAQLLLKNIFTKGASATVLRNNVIVTPNSQVEIDAVVEMPAADLIVEIKYATRPHVLLNVHSQLARAQKAYQAYWSQRGVAKKIILIAVLPSSINFPTFTDEGIIILKVNPENGLATNYGEFKSMLWQVHGVALP